jgi:VanZ family protein
MVDVAHLAMLPSLELLRTAGSGRGWLAAAVVWAALIFVLSAIPTGGSTGGVTLTGSLVHVSEYAVLAALLRRGRFSFLASIVAAVLYGATDELHQAFVPGRDAAIMDLAFDVVGALLGALLATPRTGR